MKYHQPFAVLAAVLLLGSGTIATAATDETSATAAEEAELKAVLEAEYQNALAEAKNDRQSAEAAMEKAREQLQQASEQHAEKSTEARAAFAADMAKMNEELNQERRRLRETSRELAMVNREVARARAGSETSGFIYRTSDRPLIGVILGDGDDVGVKVLGVSPDGPSEQAGLKQGDVIVALGGQVLTAIDEADDAKSGLNIAMRDIQAGEPIIISVERGDQTLDFTVVPEVREPLTWQTTTRFSSAPSSASEVMRVERIVVPQIDTEALTQQIEQIRVEVEGHRVLMESGSLAPHERSYEFEFHEFSEMGNFALHDANIWFGLPMARGLKLAEIDPGLGEYFKTDRGVLVLKAEDDNDLQLKSGDVILKVGETEVNSPAEFMRALREYHSGDELNVDIKRKRKDHTLTSTMPESQTRIFAPEDGKLHTIKITTQSD